MGKWIYLYIHSSVVYFLQMKAEKSDEQLDFERTSAYKSLPMFVQCGEDVAAGLQYSPACLHASDYLNELFKYTMNVTYKQEKVGVFLRYTFQTFSV